MFFFFSSLFSSLLFLSPETPLFSFIFVVSASSETGGGDRVITLLVRMLSPPLRLEAASKNATKLSSRFWTRRVRFLNLGNEAVDDAAATELGSIMLPLLFRRFLAKCSCLSTEGNSTGTTYTHARTEIEMLGSRCCPQPCCFLLLLVHPLAVVVMLLGKEKSRLSVYPMSNS